jgi:hypothetical protein
MAREMRATQVTHLCTGRKSDGLSLICKINWFHLGGPLWRAVTTKEVMNREQQDSNASCRS